MTVMKTLIVDDEPVARKVLREELEQIDNVVVAGEAEDGVTALAAILELRPDLVFLDLQMPGSGRFRCHPPHSGQPAHPGDRDCHCLGSARHPGVRSRSGRLPAQARHAGPARPGR